MAEKFLSADRPSGKPADLDSIRTALARIDLEAAQRALQLATDSIGRIVAVVGTEPDAAIAMLEFVTRELMAMPDRLDHVQTILGVEEVLS